MVSKPDGIDTWLVYMWTHTILAHHLNNNIRACLIHLAHQTIFWLNIQYLKSIRYVCKVCNIYNVKVCTDRYDIQSRKAVNSDLHIHLERYYMVSIP